jgi:hypothetical protein
MSAAALSRLFHGFAGDDTKAAMLRRLLTGGVPADTTPSAVSAVMNELAQLPEKGDLHVFNHWANASDEHGERTRWFEALFQWCFATSSTAPAAAATATDLSADGGGDGGGGGEDEHRNQLDFVRVFSAKTANKDGSQDQQQQPPPPASLNSKRFHVLQRIISSSTRLGAQGVDFLERYLRSTSQRYRQFYLVAMCGARSLGNDRLFEIVASLPLRTRRTVFMTAVKHRPLRVPFLERVLAEDAPVSQLVLSKHATKASSAFLVAAGLLDRRAFVFSDWLLHGAAYVRCWCVHTRAM